MTTKTWDVLSAEGVKRCCAYFASGGRCRRRTDAQGSWCAKHRPFFDRADAEFAAMMKRTNGGNKPDRADDSDASD